MHDVDGYVFLPFPRNARTRPSGRQNAGGGRRRGGSHRRGLRSRTNYDLLGRKTAYQEDIFVLHLKLSGSWCNVIFWEGKDVRKDVFIEIYKSVRLKRTNDRFHGERRFCKNIYCLI